MGRPETSAGRPADDPWSTMRRRVSLVATAATALALACGALPAVGSTPPPSGAPAHDPTTVDAPADRGPVPAFRAPASEPPADGAATGVLVRFADRTTASQQRSALAATATSSAGSVAGTGFTVVDVGDRDPAEVVADLAGDPRVRDVQLDHVRRVTAWTDDPLVEYTWPYLDLVRLPRAWDESTGDGVLVAVLDTGVAAGHPDLADAVAPGYDFVHRDRDPADDHGHGTMVTGIVASNGDNGLGHVGAAPGSRVLPVKVLDSGGRGTDSVVAEGIAYAVSSGARVINLSLGGTGESPVLLAAMQQAVAAGAVVVVAAGNASTDAAQYPAAYAAQLDGVLAVSATDDDGAVTDFSSWGDWVSVAAPGSDIVSTYGGGYSSGDGTSYAAPFVGGAAALVLATAPGLTPAQVEDRLVRSARDAGPRGVDPYYGHGVLDAAAALGVTPALPLDRVVGDGGADDVPAGATPLARLGPGSASVPGALEAEGDVDWYRFEAATPGRHDVTVTTPGAPERVQVQVLDAQGRRLASAAGSGTVMAGPVDGTGPWLVGIGAGSAAPDAAGYRVQVTWRTPQPPEVELAFAAALPLTSTYAGYDLVAADVTGDGRADALTSERVPVANPDGTWGVAPAVGLRRGTAGEAFGEHSRVRLGTGRGLQPDLVAVDLEGDGTSEVVAVTDSDVWVVRAAGGVPTATRLAGHDDARGHVTAADLEGDGDVDLLIPAASGLLALVGDGAGGLQTRTVPAWTEPTAPRVVFADVDRDGRIDAVRTGGQVLLQRADGSFTAGAAQPGLADLTAPDRATVVDVTGDGVPDVLHPAEHGVVLVPGRTAGGFGPAVTVRTSVGSFPVLQATDVDGDGLRDVVLTTERRSVGVSLQRPGGTFLSPQGADGTGDPSIAGVVVRDHDGDGDGDLLLGSASSGIQLRRQVSPVVPPGAAAWVRGSAPVASTAGLPARPRVTLTSFRDLVPGSLTARTVRLVDGDTGADVAATRSYDAATRTVALVPTADLVPGRSYEVVMTGVQATDGERMATSSRTWFTVGAGGARFTPVEPHRVLDTRSGVGVGGRATSGVPVTLALGRHVPPDATAVVLSVVAVAPSATGNVRVYPTPSPGGAVPASSNLNVVAGVDQPNLVTVALSEVRSVTLLTDGPSADLVADLAGYYSTGGATAFVPRDPVRLLDTRTGLGAPAAPVRGGQVLDLQVTGRDGVPADASAVVVNLTATGVGAPTYVGAFPTPAASEDQTPPEVSNLNLQPGRDQANLATVRVGDGGRIRLYAPSGSLHLIADLAGYYAPTGDHGFVPLPPQRVADTRTGAGVRAGVAQDRTPVDVTVAGTAGVPAGAAAAVLNVVAVEPRGSTHLRAFPTTVPATLPTVSMLNVVAGRDEANLGVQRLGDAGRVTFYPGSADVHLVVDVFGYFRRGAA